VVHCAEILVLLIEPRLLAAMPYLLIRFIINRLTAEYANCCTVWAVPEGGCGTVWAVEKVAQLGLTGSSAWAVYLPVPF